MNNYLNKQNEQLIEQNEQYLYSIHRQNNA